MIWHSARLTKTFTGIGPHYEVRLRMYVYLGDQMPGNFYYSFHTISNNTLDASFPGDVQNLLGNA